MLAARDILPESNQTLEETKQFSSEFGDFIKKLEEALKQDPDIRSSIEEIVNGYANVTNQKKDKIDKIDEVAQIEAEQEEYDQHFESLVDSIIKVPSIYYREKCFKEKTPIIFTSNQDLSTKNKSQQTKSNSAPIKLTPNKKQNTNIQITQQKTNNQSSQKSQKPNSSPNPGSRLSIHVERPKQMKSQLLIKKPKQ